MTNATASRLYLGVLIFCLGLVSCEISCEPPKAAPVFFIQPQIQQHSDLWIG